MTVEVTSKSGAETPMPDVSDTSDPIYIPDDLDLVPMDVEDIISHKEYEPISSISSITAITDRADPLKTGLKMKQFQVSKEPSQAASFNMWGEFNASFYEQAETVLDEMAKSQKMTRVNLTPETPVLSYLMNTFDRVYERTYDYVSDTKGADPYAFLTLRFVKIIPVKGTLLAGKPGNPVTYTPADASLGVEKRNYIVKNALLRPMSIFKAFYRQIRDSNIKESPAVTRVVRDFANKYYVNHRVQKRPLRLYTGKQTLLIDVDAVFITPEAWENGEGEIPYGLPSHHIWVARPDQVTALDRYTEEKYRALHHARSESLILHKPEADTFQKQRDLLHLAAFGVFSSLAFAMTKTIPRVDFILGGVAGIAASIYVFLYLFFRRKSIRHSLHLLQWDFHRLTPSQSTLVEGLMESSGFRATVRRQHPKKEEPPVSGLPAKEKIRKYLAIIAGGAKKIPHFMLKIFTAAVNWLKNHVKVKATLMWLGKCCNKLGGKIIKTIKNLRQKSDNRRSQRAANRNVKPVQNAQTRETERFVKAPPEKPAIPGGVIPAKTKIVSFVPSVAAEKATPQPRLASVLGHSPHKTPKSFKSDQVNLFLED